jgi:uncharacterized protein (TIGR02246 family)
VTSDEQQIQQLLEAWHRHSAEGDLDAVLELMTEDAVFLRCGTPPMNKEQFADGFRDWAGRATIESKYEVKEIRTCGDVGYLWSYLSIVMTSKETGGTSEREGHVLSVFRKSAAGKWQLARDANLILTGKQQEA